MMRILALLTLALLISCGGRTYQPEATTGNAPRILMMGDSLLAWNRLRGGSVARALATRLGEPVTDKSISGATYATRETGEADKPGGIGSQYKPGSWDWVVMNGGGNNLLFGCGCAGCTDELNRLISADGRAGVIPQTVAQARRGGAQVIYTGYLRSPGFTSPVEHCGPIGDQLDQRLALMAARDSGVHFLRLADLVRRPGDTTYHFIDGVHPSLKGSAAIADRLAAIIQP